MYQVEINKDYKAINCSKQDFPAPTVNSIEVDEYFLFFYTFKFKNEIFLKISFEICSVKGK